MKHVVNSDVLRSLSQGRFSYTTARAIVFLCSQEIKERGHAYDLGFIVGVYGYEVASDWNPWPTGPLALEYDLGLLDHERAATPVEITAEVLPQAFGQYGHA